MYADDTVTFAWGKNNVEVAARLTKVMVDVSDWLNKCCLQLNNSKTVAMFFSKTSKSHTEPDVFISDQRIKIVKEYKYLGILIDNQLTFKKHVKKICNILKNSPWPTLGILEITCPPRLLKCTCSR